MPCAAAPSALRHAPSPTCPHCRYRQVATKGQAHLLTWIVWVLNVLFVLAAAGLTSSLQTYDTLEQVQKKRVMGWVNQMAGAAGMLGQDAPLPAHSPLPVPGCTLPRLPPCTSYTCAWAVCAWPCWC